KRAHQEKWVTQHGETPWIKRRSRRPEVHSDRTACTSGQPHHLFGGLDLTGCLVCSVLRFFLLDPKQLGRLGTEAGEFFIVRSVFRVALRRTVSTRMRRMASAAAAKKWPRLSQCWAFSTSTSRRFTSWTKAVAWSVCPGFSCASFWAASRRNSS